MRGLGAIAIAAGALISMPAYADMADPPGDIAVSGQIQIVSDYRYRGLSRSGGDFAAQAALDIDHVSGFYTGVWLSSVDETPFCADAEVDIYAGWSPQVGSVLTVDAGLRYYLFAGSVEDADFFEPYASLAAWLGPATAKLGFAYAWPQRALDDDDNLYVYANLGTGIPNTPLSVDMHLGYSEGALSPKRLTGLAGNGGFDWSLKVTYVFSRNLSIGASYVGAQGRVIDSLSNDTLLGTLSFSF